MPRVLHVIDRTCHETHAQLIDMLLRRLGGKADAHAVAALDARVAERLQPYFEQPIQVASQQLLRSFNIATGLRRVARQHDADVLHVWGPEALAVVAATLPDAPRLLTVIEPRQAEDLARRVRALADSPGVVAGSQHVRQLLVEAGVPPERCVVVRGPADFGAIKRARESDLRARLIDPDAGPVLLMSGPPERGAGQFEAVWAAAIVRQIYPDLRVILPYPSAERGRVERYAIRMTDERFAVLPPAGWSWSELAVVADAFVMTPSAEVSTEPLAAVMAAGVPIVATAVRSIAEIVADRHNGLLCKDNSLQQLSGRILTALEDKALVRNITDVARSQAFEVFGVRAFVDNYERAYENVMNDAELGAGVSDTAVVS